MNTASDHNVEAIEQAEARRQRVFRRMIFGVVLFIVLLILIHLWWGWEAGRRLQAEIDRCHAAGEPILVSDFPSSPTIPDEENAAYYYQQAVLAIKPTDNPALTWTDTVQGTRSAWKTYARDIMASVRANEPALALIRKSRACPRTDWGFRYRSPLINANVPLPNVSRDASRLTALAARAYHSEGDHAEVLDLLIDSEGIVHNTAQHQCPGIIPHLLLISSASYVVETIEDLMPTIVSDEAKPVSKTWSCAHPITRFRSPPVDGLVMELFRMLALRRMAATAIAIRLHELEHGRRPASLEELAPEYLPAVPEDPFADGGRKLGYRPDSSSPVLYSVNVDGRDDQGKYELGQRGEVLRDADLVFFLAGDRPLGAPPPRRSESPSSKAEDHQD